MTTEANTLREIIANYTKYRAEWIAKWGTEAGFNEWFSTQIDKIPQNIPQVEPVEQKPSEPEQIYTEGKIVTFSWGYEQTNIDFYIIKKRSGDFATLQPMTSKILTNDDMRGSCVPDQPDLTQKTIRRKVHKRDGKECGVAIKSYGWASLWDGQPEHFTSYA